MSMGTTRTPEEIYNYMRRLYQIPEEMSYEEARKVLSIWQEVQLMTYRAYVPVTIAYDVSVETVAEVETRSMELEGMSTAEGSVRVYPKLTLAAHSIGYMGKMTNAETVEAMVAKGYSMDDTIGISGIEASMEGYLNGNETDHQGKQEVEVSSSGKVIRVLNTQPAVDGDDVVLTLDMELQQVATQALQKNIENVRAEQERILSENLETYQKKAKDNDVSNIKLAETGSVVVMDIKTGEVLAIDSNPSYDLNLFTGGISTEDYKSLSEDPRLPLFNRAIASKTMPGSIFKMSIALAGLEEGVVTIDEEIDDEGPYTKYTTTTVGAPRCWVNPYYSRHADCDVVKALEVSCNYYFFTVADRLGIDLINKWCSKLGLDTLTGIEIPGETAGQIGGQKVLFDNTKENIGTGVARLVFNQLVRQLRGYCEKLEKEVDDAALETCAEKLLRIIDDREVSEWKSDILRIMREDLGIAETVTNNNYWHAEIYSILLELRWNPNQTVRTGIGQAVVSVTPIAVARYMSALLNGGKVYNATIIKRIVDAAGKVVKEEEPQLVEDLGVSAQNLEAIKEGMKKVVSLEDGGTAGTAYQNFKYVDQVGGKTGSAQVSTSENNIDLENTAWHVAFAPYDDPEIVVVVCIPNGKAGSMAVSTAQDIIEFYLDRKYNVAKENIPGTNELLP